MITLENISKAVADYYKISVEQMFQKTRRRDILEARQFFHYLSYTLSMKVVSLNQIARYPEKLGLESWDHSTVLHSYRRINDLLETEALMRFKMQEIVDVPKEVDVSLEKRLARVKFDLVRDIMDAKSVMKIQVICEAFLERENNKS